MEGRLLVNWLNGSLVTGAVAPERLAPVRGSAEGVLVAYFVFGQPIVFICNMMIG